MFIVESTWKEIEEQNVAAGGNDRHTIDRNAFGKPLDNPFPPAALSLGRL